MAALEVKDKVILGHIYLYASAMTVFLFKHAEQASVIAPAIAGLLGLTHWFVVHDDKTEDAK